MSKKEQDHIAKYAGNSIRYMPAVAHATGSVNASIMLSQLLFWHGQGDRSDGYTYKTVENMNEETGLTRDQQATAKKVLVSFGLIDIKLMSVPARNHFLVHIDNLACLLSSWRENTTPGIEKALFKKSRKHVSITKTTQTHTKRPHTNVTSNISSEPALYLLDGSYL